MLAGWGKGGFGVMASPPGQSAPQNLVNYTPQTGEVHDRGMSAPSHLWNYTLMPGPSKVGMGQAVGTGQTTDTSDPSLDSVFDAASSASGPPTQQAADDSGAAQPTGDQGNQQSPPDWGADTYPSQPPMVLGIHKVQYALDSEGKPIVKNGKRLIMFVDANAYGPDDQSQNQALKDAYSAKPQTTSQEKTGQEAINRKDITSGPYKGWTSADFPDPQNPGKYTRGSIGPDGTEYPGKTPQQAVSAGAPQHPGAAPSGNAQASSPSSGGNQGLREYFTDVLDQLGMPATDTRLNLLIAQARNENTQAAFNPLATTLDSPGATDFNSVHVRNYSSYEAGVAATAQTIRGSFPGMLKALQDEDPAAYIAGLHGSYGNWGTSPSGVAQTYSSLAGSPPPDVPLAGSQGGGAASSASSGGDSGHWEVAPDGVTYHFVPAKSWVHTQLSDGRDAFFDPNTGKAYDLNGNPISGSSIGPPETSVSPGSSVGHFDTSTNKWVTDYTAPNRNSYYPVTSGPYTASFNQDTGQMGPPQLSDPSPRMVGQNVFIPGGAPTPAGFQTSYNPQSTHGVTPQSLGLGQDNDAMSQMGLQNQQAHLNADVRSFGVGQDEEDDQPLDDDPDAALKARIRGSKTAGGINADMLYRPDVDKRSPRDQLMPQVKPQEWADFNNYDISGGLSGDDPLWQGFAEGIQPSQYGDMASALLKRQPGPMQAPGRNAEVAQMPGQAPQTGFGMLPQMQGRGGFGMMPPMAGSGGFSGLPQMPTSTGFGSLPGWMQQGGARSAMNFGGEPVDPNTPGPRSNPGTSSDPHAMSLWNQSNPMLPMMTEDLMNRQPPSWQSLNPGTGQSLGRSSDDERVDAQLLKLVKQNAQKPPMPPMPPQGGPPGMGKPPMPGMQGPPRPPMPGGPPQPGMMKPPGMGQDEGDEEVPQWFTDAQKHQPPLRDMPEYDPLFMKSTPPPGMTDDRFDSYQSGPGPFGPNNMRPLDYKRQQSHGMPFWAYHRDPSMQNGPYPEDPAMGGMATDPLKSGWGMGQRDQADSMGRGYVPGSGKVDWEMQHGAGLPIPPSNNFQNIAPPSRDPGLTAPSAPDTQTGFGMMPQMPTSTGFSGLPGMQTSAGFSGLPGFARGGNTRNAEDLSGLSDEELSWNLRMANANYDSFMGGPGRAPHPGVTMQQIGALRSTMRALQDEMARRAGGQLGTGQDDDGDAAMEGAFGVSASDLHPGMGAGPTDKSVGAARRYVSQYPEMWRVGTGAGDDNSILVHKAPQTTNAPGILRPTQWLQDLQQTLPWAGPPSPLQQRLAAQRQQRENTDYRSPQAGQLGQSLRQLGQSPPYMPYSKPPNLDYQNRAQVGGNLESLIAAIGGSPGNMSAPPTPAGYGPQQPPSQAPAPSPTPPAPSPSPITLQSQQVPAGPIQGPPAPTPAPAQAPAGFLDSFSPNDVQEQPVQYNQQTPGGGWEQVTRTPGGNFSVASLMPQDVPTPDQQLIYNAQNRATGGFQTPEMNVPLMAQQMGQMGTGQDEAMHGQTEGENIMPPVNPAQVEGTGNKFGQAVSMEGTHKGTDLQAIEGTPVFAPADGVVHVVMKKGLGLQVIITDKRGVSHELGHLLAATVKDGQKVRKGDVVGQVGESGIGATGPHLDYRAQNRNGDYLDSDKMLGPLAQLPESPNTVKDPNDPNQMVGGGQSFVGTGAASPQGGGGFEPNSAISSGFSYDPAADPSNSLFNPNNVSSSNTGFSQVNPSYGTTSNSAGYGSPPPSQAPGTSQPGQLGIGPYQQAYLDYLNQQEKDQYQMGMAGQTTNYDQLGMQNYWNQVAANQALQQMQMAPLMQGTWAQNAYQQQLQTALNNPWVQGLTGMRPGWGLPGGAQSQSQGGAQGGNYTLANAMSMMPVGWESPFSWYATQGISPLNLSNQWLPGTNPITTPTNLGSIGGINQASGVGQAVGRGQATTQTGPTANANTSTPSTGTTSTDPSLTAWQTGSNTGQTGETGGSTPWTGGSDTSQFGQNFAPVSWSDWQQMSPFQQSGWLTFNEQQGLSQPQIMTDEQNYLATGQSPQNVYNMEAVPSGIMENEAAGQAGNYSAGQKIYTDPNGYAFIEVPTSAGANWVPTGTKMGTPGSFSYAPSSGSWAQTANPSATTMSAAPAGFQGMTSAPQATMQQYNAMSPLDQQSWANTMSIFGMTPQQALAGLQRQWSTAQGGGASGMGWA